MPRKRGAERPNGRYDLASGGSGSRHPLHASRTIIKVSRYSELIDIGGEMDVGRVLRMLRAVGTDAEIAETGITLAGAATHLEDMGSRPATPSDLVRIATSLQGSGARPAVSARRASPAAIAWVLTHPDVVLVLDDRVVIDGVEHRLGDEQSVTRRRKGPSPSARLAVARVLLSGASRKNQIRLAELAGVTQGSVSNALRRLPEIHDPGAAFDELVRDYPGPGGQSYYWWSSAPLNEQAQLLAVRQALLSGDFAADRIAPWRMPERVVAYTESPLDLSPAGFVLADPGDYTTLVVVPADPTLRATAKAWGTDDVTDPIIAAHDVLRTATTGDENEAVDKLRDLVIQRFVETTRHD